jgi:hypothetical protein
VTTGVEDLAESTGGHCDAQDEDCWPGADPGADAVSVRGESLGKSAQDLAPPLSSRGHT